MASLDIEFKDMKSLGLVEIITASNNALIDQLDMLISRCRSKLWIHYLEPFETLTIGNFVIEKGYKIYKENKLVCQLDTGNGLRKIFLDGALRVDRWSSKNWEQTKWYKR